MCFMVIKMENQIRRKQLIKLIHIAQSKLGMDKETYRAFLVNTVKNLVALT